MAEVYHVDPKGDDAKGNGSNDRPWRKIQHALDECEAGDTVLVHRGEYLESVEFNESGSKSKGPITLMGEEGATISGKGTKDQHLIRAENQSYLRIINLDLVDIQNNDECAAIMIEGAGSNITIRQCRIARCRGKNAIGIAFYGTHSKMPLSEIEIDGNTISDCEPAPSETLVLNGNVMNFKVTNNTIRNVNNIGIDFIGGEKDVVKDITKVARQGVCTGNRVENARSNYGGGYAAGIYVDGGRDIVIESNVVTQCDMGIEVGAENKGVVTSGIVVKQNVFYKNDKAGIVFGGYDAKRGRVEKCEFLENQCYQNTTHAKPQAELWIQQASGNVVKGNSFWIMNQKLMAQIDHGGEKNEVDENIWFSEEGGNGLTFEFAGLAGKGFANWQSKTAWDKNGKFTKWKFTVPNGAP